MFPVDCCVQLSLSSFVVIQPLGGNKGTLFICLFFAFNIFMLRGTVYCHTFYYGLEFLQNKVL